MYGKSVTTIQIKNIEHFIVSRAVVGNEQRKVCGPATQDRWREGHQILKISTLKKMTYITHLYNSRAGIKQVCWNKILRHLQFKDSCTGGVECNDTYWIYGGNQWIIRAK